MVRAAGNIGNLYSHRGRTAVRSATVAADAGQGKIIDVMARTVLVWAGLAIAGNGAVDEARVDGFEGFIPNAKAAHHPGPELLDHDVKVFYQLQHLVCTALFLQVKRQ